MEISYKLRYFCCVECAWKNQDMNQGPGRMPALQAIALPATCSASLLKKKCSQRFSYFSRLKEKYDIHKNQVDHKHIKMFENNQMEL